jgi:hypothetical protein
MIDGLAGIVVGDCDATEPAALRSLDHGFGGTARIRRIVGVEMQVEGVSHPGILSGACSRCQASRAIVCEIYFLTAGVPVNWKGMAVAFKEWVLVCDALGKGEQSVILRKGGIAEGRAGFTFEHEDFYLFPTWFHGQLDKIRGGGFVLPAQVPETVTIGHAVTVEWSGRITDKEAVQRLEKLHVLEPSVIEERFVYSPGKKEQEGIHVAFVRIYRLEPAVSFPMEPRFGGCRSWVEIPEIDPGALVSVLSDEDHRRRRELFSQLLGVSF